ncbi:MAG: hypothetical protein HOV81_11020 [Kofleriaceae bacterium]|nr:hypothetical protein [Kofleriaceae bacterium]
MRASVVLVLAAAACGRSDTTPSAPAATEPPPVIAPKVEPIAKGVPHGGMISEVAVTEEADAALSFDTLRGIRLWPTLDGTRAPVPVSADAPHELALAHTGKDLLAAILDDAGGVRVLRLGLDGSVRGRASLPGEYEQVIALPAGVVVRTKDHAIEWYGPDGTPKGRVIADAAQQVYTLVARRGRVAALVGKAQNGYGHIVRWLGLGTTLAWGDSVELPLGAKGELFALSPSGRRVALADQGDQIRVYDLANIKPTEIQGTALTAPQATAIGFLDDSDVAIANPASTLSVWHPAHPAPANDPWSVKGSASSMPVPTMSHFIDGVAIGDGTVVSGYGTSLALSTTSKVRYLGWKSLATGNLMPVGNQFTMAVTGSHYVWIDDKLHAQRDLELRPNDRGPWVYGYPVDERHVVTQTPNDGKYDVELVDLDREGARTKLGTYDSVDRIEYSPDTHLLAVGRTRKIERFRLDLDANTATPEAPLAVRGSPISVRLLDPAKADGVVAITVGWENDWDSDNTLTLYKQDGKKITKKRIKPFGGQMLSIDSTGTMYLLARNDTNEIRVQKGTKVLSKFALPELTQPIAVADDGARIAYVAKGEIVMLDSAGKQLWRVPLWGSAQLAFTRDGQKLVARAIGGVVVLDSATGVRTAMECGWDFGLMTEAPPVMNAGSPPVCEDPTLQ